MADQPTRAGNRECRNRSAGQRRHRCAKRRQPRPQRPRPTRFRCVICGKEKPARDVTQLDVVRPSLIDRIKADHPDLPAEGYICSDDLDRFRSRYVSELLGQERGELTKLEQEVVQSLADHETLAENIEAEWVGHRTFGERLSDHLASFGGSWTFIIIFFAVLVVWMAFNVGHHRAATLRSLSLHPAQSGAVVPGRHPGADHHDEPEAAGGEGPAAVGERLPGQLKAELEIRHLHEKVDHILTRQWERLAEIQQIQLEIMQDPAIAQTLSAYADRMAGRAKHDGSGLRRDASAGIMYTQRRGLIATAAVLLATQRTR